ncbi:MAG: hypothetical protein PHH01_00610 [Patescibacteria group bacterium]|nr:hypothetical protein [Patescibacteria group bacterium]
MLAQLENLVKTGIKKILRDEEDILILNGAPGGPLAITDVLALAGEDSCPGQRRPATGSSLIARLSLRSVSLLPFESPSQHAVGFWIYT